MKLNVNRRKRKPVTQWDKIEKHNIPKTKTLESHFKSKKAVFSEIGMSLGGKNRQSYFKSWIEEKRMNHLLERIKTEADTINLAQIEEMEKVEEKIKRQKLLELE